MITAMLLQFRRKGAVLLFVTIIMVISFGCSENDDETVTSIDTDNRCTDQAPTAGESQSSATINGTKWAYMLQGDVSAVIESTTFDTIVMDYSSDGTESGRYSSTEMDVIQSGGRQALSYLSIGEAENYRFYFQSSWLNSNDQPADGAPCWLGTTNPDWEGNYKAQYWSDDWQETVLSYLDKIIADGFDGIYLDIIDAFEYWSTDGIDEGFTLTEEEAAARMINFVKRIAVYARDQDPDFLIFPQNGESLLAYDKDGSYLAAINGIGIEDLYYDERTTASDTAERSVYLDRIDAAGKKVIVVDYTYDGSADAIVNDFISQATTDGFYPYAAATDRELDELVTFSGQGNP